MLGLIYKDFTAQRGKKFLLFMAVSTALFIILRVTFPGTRYIDGFMIENDKGMTINMIDTFFWIIEYANIMLGFTMVNKWVGYAVTNDEKNKTQNYLFSMPFDKKTYVASKYILILLSTVFMLLVVELWNAVCRAFTGPGLNMDYIRLLERFIIPFFSVSLIVAAFELPMFLLWGKDRAMLVKVGFMMLLGFIVVGYILFGDLSFFDGIDMERVMILMVKYAKEIRLFVRLMPAGALLLYGGSFLLTAWRFERKET